VAPEAPHPVVARTFALVDPPYTQKGEWADAAHAVAQARSPRTSIALWYPIKALTRPRGMLSALVEAGVHGTVVELVSTPLRLKREKLNGSGLIFVNVPDAAVAAVCAALVRLGPRVATHGEWSAAQIGF
jgi:23S rRNA A2030 N6-methylase RlmJ